MRIERFKKANQVLIFGVLVLSLLYVGASLFIPLTFAIFFAALIFPVVHWLEKTTGAGKTVSSLVGTLFIFMGVGILIFFMVQQLGLFLQDIVESQEHILTYFRSLQLEVADMTGFSLEQQEQAIEDSVMQILNFTQTYVSGILAGIAGILLNFLITTILMFLVLQNRNKFKKFLMMYVKPENREKTETVISKTTKVAQQYLWGRLQVMAILAVLYFILFTSYDLRHTGLLILFGALITIIPYIGPLISGVVPVLFLIIFDGSYAEVLSFTIIIAVIQLIESYVLEPVLIGSEVEQSPLFIILAILLGGIVWGPAGLILFVPIFSILKIIFDHTSGLEPIGFLVGYERPGAGESLLDKLKNKFKK